MIWIDAFQDFPRRPDNYICVFSASDNKISDDNKESNGIRWQEKIMSSLINIYSLNIFHKQLSLPYCLVYLIKSIFFNKTPCEKYVTIWLNLLYFNSLHFWKNHHCALLAQWLLHKYKCLWGMERKGPEFKSSEGNFTYIYT